MILRRLRNFFRRIFGLSPIGEKTGESASGNSVQEEATHMDWLEIQEILNEEKNTVDAATNTPNQNAPPQAEETIYTKIDYEETAKQAKTAKPNNGGQTRPNNKDQGKKKEIIYAELYFGEDKNSNALPNTPKDPVYAEIKKTPLPEETIYEEIDGIKKPGQEQSTSAQNSNDLPNTPKDPVYAEINKKPKDPDDTRSKKTREGNLAIRRPNASPPPPPSQTTVTEDAPSQKTVTEEDGIYENWGKNKPVPPPKPKGRKTDDASKGNENGGGRGI